VKRAIRFPPACWTGGGNLTGIGFAIAATAAGAGDRHVDVPVPGRPIPSAAVASTRLVADLLRDAAQAFPERDAYVHGEKRATYAWLDRAADGFAATLLEHGVARGDVVVLLLPSSIKLAVCYLGALRAGAITSAVNLRLGPREQASIVGRTQPRVTVVGDGATAPSGVDPGLVLPVTALKEAFAADPPTRLPKLDPSDPTCIVWTSGTTGAPKGAVYDHERQAAISRNVGELTSPGDRRLVVLPFPHVGYMTRMWDELANATTIVLAGEPWSATETLRIIRDEAITMATGVPTQWQLVLDHPDVARTDFSGLRVAGIGAASIPPELVRRMRETLGCPVITRYTSTEAGVTTSTLATDPPEVIANTVGRPTPEVALRIIDPASGNDQARGDVGEVICRSPAMMQGYWRAPELTATVIDANGWLHTGDLGFVGDDDNLRLVGRLKEMYIRGGYNIYPAEVEAVLSEHPDIAAAAVVGAPDPVLGEVGVAFLVPVPGAATAGVEREALRAWCRDRLADYKSPDRIVLVDDLPVTAMMKIDKRALLERASPETSETATEHATKDGGST
jgi:acyl-CoA synthetase (AMP-forming)/AMP-acid ligase II